MIKCDAKIDFLYTDVDEWWTRLVRSDTYPPESSLLQGAVERYLQSNIRPGLKLLDAGCGEGRFARFANGLGADVWGIDRSEILLQAAGSSRVARGDITKLPFQHHTFDVVICIMVLMLVKDLNQAIAELQRVTKPRGSCFFAILHPCFDRWGVKDAPPFDDGDHYYREHSRYWKFPTSQSESLFLSYLHRPLSTYISSLAQYFIIDDVEELIGKTHPGSTTRFAHVEYILLNTTPRG